MKPSRVNSHTRPNNLARFFLRILAGSNARLWTWIRFTGLVLIVASTGCSSTLTTAPFCRALQETVCPCPPATDQTAVRFATPSPLVWSEPIPDTLPSLYANTPLLDFDSPSPPHDIRFSSQTIPLFVLPSTPAHVE